MNAPDADGSTALHYAAWNGKARCAELLLRAGASVRCRDKLGCTPLHRAAMEGHAECAFVLLNLGAVDAATVTNQDMGALG